MCYLKTTGTNVLWKETVKKDGNTANNIFFDILYITISKYQIFQS